MCHRHLSINAVLLVAILLILVGCGGSGSPISPGNPVSEGGRSGAGGNHQCWGFYSIGINPDTLEAEIVPLRSAEFTLNVTKFMQPPISPINLITISIDIGESNIAGDLLSLDVTLRHPFPGLNLYRGFDVRGIFMANASQAAGFDPTATYANWSAAGELQPTTEPVLLNADGYTRWWNPAEFTTYGTVFGYTKGNMSPGGFTANATLNPYKYFADELTDESPFVLDPANRGTFSTNPGINVREYVIQFSSKPWQFNYGIDASWSLPDTPGAPDYPIDSFALSANAQEAYQVVLTDAGSSAYWSSSSVYGGDFKLDVEIFDWQAEGASLNPSVILEEIKSVWLESPALGDGAVHYIDVAAGAYEILPGSVDASAILRVSINPNFTDPPGIDKAGDYPVLIGVESSDPFTYKPQVDGGDVFAYPPAPLTAFFTSWVTVSGETPNDPPLVLSVIPSMGKQGSLLSDVEIHGLNFIDGATVEFKHEGGSYSIGPLAGLFVDSTLLTIDLDLTSAELGMYDVTVTNPDLLQGTLEDGFEVVELFPVLVLDDEVAFPPYTAGTDAYTPAIVEETDGDITFCFEEYKLDGNQSVGASRASSDDGLTWPKAEAGIWSWGGTLRHWDTLKVIRTTYGNTYHTTQLYEPYEELFSTGFFVEAFTQNWPWPQGCHVTQNVSHFTELLMDKDHYFYAIGDMNGQIQFKRSEVPEEIQGGPSAGIWASFPVYTISTNGFLSRARSSELYADVMYLAYFEPNGNVIRLAYSDSDWQVWNTSTVVWDGTDTGTSTARDPGLQVDETGYHITFVRHNDNTNQDELCYTWSSDKTAWSEPVVIRASAETIQDSPVERYLWDDFGPIQTLGTVWWEGTLIYASFSLDIGASWSDPIVLSEMYGKNKQCDFVIGSTKSWHFVWSAYNPNTTKTEIHYRRGHMETQ